MWDICVLTNESNANWCPHKSSQLPQQLLLPWPRLLPPESASWAKFNEFQCFYFSALTSNLKGRDNAGLISPSCTANRTPTHTLNKRMVDVTWFMNIIFARKLLQKEMKFVWIMKYLHRSCGCNCHRPSSRWGLNIWGTPSVQNHPPEDQSLARRRQS